MKLTLYEALKRGVEAQQAGDIQAADKFYTAILNAQPTHPDANHNMGILAVGIGKLEEAIPFLKAAIKANPTVEQFWISYIGTLIEQQQFADAKQAIFNAMKAGVVSEKINALVAELNLLADEKIPPQARVKRLSEYYKTGNYGDAEKLAISITQEFPKYQLGWKVLGAILQQTGRISESLDSVQNAVDIVPQDAEAYNNLGITLMELGRLDEAEVSFSQAIVLQSNYVEAHNNLGIVLKELGRFDDAEASYKQVIALKSDYPEAHSNLGIMLQELNRLEEAEASHMQAIALKPDFANAHYNLGITLKELGRFDEAEGSYNQALALKPDYPEAKFHKALLLLNRQSFQLGWSLYFPELPSKTDVTSAYFTERVERWKGSSLRGKNIQVYGTQGVGDEIMFSSCIPDLVQESSNAIYLECNPRLRTLFARSFPQVTVYGREREYQSPPIYGDTDILIEDIHFDYSIPIDGLPQFFRNNIEDFRGQDAFLVPAHDCVDKWSKRLADLGEGLKVGISWLGGGPKDQKNNSIPLAHWNNLLSLDAFFINLQYGDTSDEVARFKEKNNIKIYDWEDNNALVDLDSQAALISELDLVISVDNATVHSCIALGTEVWNMLDPSFNLMWMDKGMDTSPLSRHVHLFKKKPQDSWGNVLNRVEQQLSKRLMV